MTYSSYQLLDGCYHKILWSNKVFYPNFTNKVHIDTLYASIWGENTHHFNSYSNNIKGEMTITIIHWLVKILYTSTYTGSYHLFYFNLTSFKIYSHTNILLFVISQWGCIKRYMLEFHFMRYETIQKSIRSVHNQSWIYITRMVVGFHPMGVSHTVVHYPYFPSTTIKGSPLPFPIVLEKGECFNTVLSTMNCGEVLRQYLHLLGNKRGKNRYIRPLLCLYFVGIYIHIFYIVIHTYMKHVRQ